MFAPNAKIRPRLKALMPPLSEQQPVPDENKPEAGLNSQRRWWTNPAWVTAGQRPAGCSPVAWGGA